MISEEFAVGAHADRMAAINVITQNFAWQNWLDKKSALRLMLLVEETLGMLKSMIDDYEGSMWLSYEKGTCEIHLKLKTSPMDKETKKELLSVSSSGKNVYDNGFMQMVGGIIRQLLNNVGSDVYTDAPDLYDISPVWTLETYRARLSDQPDERAFDDLERSIVASLADDVIVGVKDNFVRMIIVKKFGEDKDQRNMSVAETMLVDNLWAKARLAQ
ncbi:MAG: hypothetical protein J5589_05250 [Firmicutes bacterium]|nr:hypothetical protein [Bacillota bacterium]